MGDFDRRLILHKNWHWVWDRHGLLDGESFRNFNDLGWNVLLANQISEIHKLLARLFQVGEIFVHGKIETRSGTIVMDAVDLLLNVLLLLLIKELQLSLQLFRLLIKFLEIEWDRGWLEVLGLLNIILVLLWTRSWMMMMQLNLIVSWRREMLLLLILATNPAQFHARHN